MKLPEIYEITGFHLPFIFRFRFPLSLVPKAVLGLDFELRKVK
jgi:hypothetical protein